MPKVEAKLFELINPDLLQAKRCLITYPPHSGHGQCLEVPGIGIFRFQSPHQREIKTFFDPEEGTVIRVMSLQGHEFPLDQRRISQGRYLDWNCYILTVPRPQILLRNDEARRELSLKAIFDQTALELTPVRVVIKGPLSSR